MKQAVGRKEWKGTKEVVSEFALTALGFYVGGFKWVAGFSAPKGVIRAGGALSQLKLIKKRFKN